MTLWRINNGVPSLADALLVVGGPSFLCASIVPCTWPIIEVYEPSGLAYLGCFAALLVVAGIAFGGVRLFLHNEKKLRSEIIFARRFFAPISVPIILVALDLTSKWVWKTGIGLFEHLGLLVLALLPLYGLVVAAALRFPQRVAAVAFWIYAGLAALSVLAKFARLFMRR